MNLRLSSLLLGLSLGLFGSLHCSELQEFPTFGVKIKAPGGWERVPEASQGQIARWARLDGSGTEAKDVVVLELAQLEQNLSPHSYAKAVARQYKGQIDAKVKLGYLPAVEVRSQHRTEVMSPRQTRAAAHRGHLWILSFWSSGKGSLARKTISAMAKSVVWFPPVPPSEHLALTDKPISMLKGRIRVPMPRIARPARVNDPKMEAAMGIRNVARGNMEFIFKAQLPEGDYPTEPAEVKARFAAYISAKFPGAGELAWQNFDLGDAKGSFLVPLVVGAEPGKPRFREYHYVLLMRGEDVYLLSFFVSGWDEASFLKFRGLTKQITRSIELAK